MSIRKHIPYFILAGFIFLCLKFFHSKAETDQLYFLLYPVNAIVSSMLSAESIYVEGVGFYFNRFNIYIDKSCSGMNYWLICFLVFTFLFQKFTERTIVKIILLPLTLIGTYLFAILVNSFRIYATLLVEYFLRHTFPSGQSILHESVGIIINLGFLVVVYFFSEKLLNRTHSNAILSKS